MKRAKTSILYCSYFITHKEFPVLVIILVFSGICLTCYNYVHLTDINFEFKLSCSYQSDYYSFKNNTEKLAASTVIKKSIYPNNTYTIESILLSMD